MSRLNFFAIISISLAAALLILPASYAYSNPTAENLDRFAAADALYSAGEQATSATVREAAFNEALAAYSALEAEYSNGALYYNIGNCYFQLAQYPWSILYYERALLELPRSAKVRDHLELAQRRAGIAIQATSPLWRLLLAPHSTLSHLEKRALLFWSGLVSFFALSAWIWSAKTRRLRRFLWQIGCGFAVVSLFFLLSLTVSYYLTPMRAVLIHASPLYKDAGEHYATVNEHWLGAGTTLHVLEIGKDGGWLKVQHIEDGGQCDEGYVSHSYLRVI